MRKFFGMGKKEEPEPPKKEISKEDLREKQKGFKKSLNKEIRELDRQIFSLILY